MESAVSFAPLRPADFVNFAGRGGAGQGLLFAGRGGAGRGVHPWLTLAGEGQFTRATQALTSCGMADKSRATVKLLRDKHPAPSHPIGPLPTTNSDPLSLYGPNVFKSALKFKKGTAPGPSGLRPEHLRVVLQSPTTRREGASNALTKLLNKMVAGLVPPQVAPYLCGARLHASKKRDGGIRPIAVGDLLRRLASKCVAEAVSGKAAALFSPLQHGVGVRNGCEAIVHATRGALDKDGTKFVMQADFINAFNTADRAVALQEVAHHFPEILPWCTTSYGAPSILLFGNTIILGRSGFQQGDPLASLLFALTLHPVLLAIKQEVPSLVLNAWYLDDGTLVGDLQELGAAVDILERDCPARGLILSTRNTVTPPSEPKTTLWSPQTFTADADPLGKGIPRVNSPGITLLGAPIGSEAFIKEAINAKLEKISQITSLLPTLQDAQTEYCLLRSCLSLPKIMFILRTVNTVSHPHFLAEFDRLTREALTRILGTPLPPAQWDQSKLPISMGGLGLRAAEDHAAAAYAISFTSSQKLAGKMLAAPEDQEPAPLPLQVLTALTHKLGEETTTDSLQNHSQKMLSLQIDLGNQKQLSELVEAAGEREVARMASLSLPYAGAWLTCSPIKALGLHMRGPEFVAAVKLRLGLQVYARAGKCPSCGKDSDVLGDHAMVCGTGGERISRHNALRDALFETAASAGLAPVREERALLPGNDRRPADLLIRHWAGGRDAALDVTVTHPLQNLTRAGAAATPGHAASVAYDRKVRGAGELCQAQGLAFIPIVAESLGGWHSEAVVQIKKIGSALARHTGQEEGEVISHLVSRCSLLLQRGSAALLLNRIPGHPAAADDGML